VTRASERSAARLTCDAGRGSRRLPRSRPGSCLVVQSVSSAQLAAVVHAVVEDANDKHADFVSFDEDGVAAAGGHLDAWPEVVATE